MDRPSPPKRERSFDGPGARDILGTSSSSVAGPSRFNLSTIIVPSETISENIREEIEEEGNLGYRRYNDSSSSDSYTETYSPDSYSHPNPHSYSQSQSQSQTSFQIVHTNSTSSLPIFIQRLQGLVTSQAK